METSGAKKQRIRSLFMVHLSMLIFSLGNSIIVTGVWPYLQAVSAKLLRNESSIPYMDIVLQLDPSVTMKEYGFVVAADALAQMIFSPIFGYIADKMDSVRLVSYICGTLFTIGNICYGTIALVPKSLGSVSQARLYAMLVARFIVGTGTGLRTFMTLHYALCV